MTKKVLFKDTKLFRSKTVDFIIGSPTLNANSPKISRGTDEDDMMKLKKAALGISGKLGLLNTHRSLVVAVSEEKQVHEALLKVVLSRVNAGTSLLRWAKTEENTDIRDCIHRLYDVNLMWATVQKEYIEQNNALMTSLKDILQIEAGLDALQKHLKQVTEKKEKLKQRKLNGIHRKLEKQESLSDEIDKLHDEEESLKSELEVKCVKAEIFKTRALKSSITKISDAHLQLSQKMNLIFSTTKEIVQSLDDMPSHLRTNKAGEEEESTSEENDVVSALAESLNVPRPSSSSLPRSSSDNEGKEQASVFHVDLPKSPHSTLSKRNAANNQAKNNNNFSNNNNNQQQQQPQKKISGAKLFKRMFGMGGGGGGQAAAASKPEVPTRMHRPQFDTDFVMVSTNSPPSYLPPPGFQPDTRRRSRSTIDPPTFIKSHHHRNKEVNNNQSTVNKSLPEVESESDDDDDDDYVIPNERRESLRRTRSSSESRLDTINHEKDYGYCRPWDLSPPPLATKHHEYDTPEGRERPKYLYSRAYDHFNGRNVEDSFSTYQDPKDCIAEAEQLYSDFSGINERDEDSDEGLYDTPYDIKKQVEELYRSRSLPHRPQPRAGDEEITVDDTSEESNESIYQNSLKLLDEIQYMDTDVFRRPIKIQSKPDASSGQIIVEQKSPLQIPRDQQNARSEANEMNGNRIAGAEITRPLPKKPIQNKKRKSPVLPLKPKPTPRPKSGYIDQTLVEDGGPNVRDLAQQLKTKIRPTATVPNITQAKMAVSERISYENNDIKNY